MRGRGCDDERGKGCEWMMMDGEGGLRWMGKDDDVG